MKKCILTIWVVPIFAVLFFQSSVIAQTDLEDKVEGAISGYYYNEFDITADDEGNVTLEGKVNTLYDKYRIFEFASKVPGVRTIQNQLIVDTPVLADEMIENNIREEMKYVSSIVEPDRITVEVTNGVAFLDGKVSYYREKKMMRTLTSWQKGVKGVVNRLEVLPPDEARSDDNIKVVLNQIMKYEFPIEDNVSIMINDGVVTLEGTTSNLWAKRNIVEEFSGVLGVREIENNLDVETTEY